MHLRPILQLLANRQFEEDDHCCCSNFKYELFIKAGTSHVRTGPPPPPPPKKKSRLAGYSSGRGPRSKRAMSIAPDYGYKRRSTNREALHACTQPEGIGYLARAMFYGRSNFGNF